MKRKKRRIHVCPPARATEIYRALKITKAEMQAAQAAIEAALGKGKK